MKRSKQKGRICRPELDQTGRNFVAYFGGCPECGGYDGVVNVGRSNWLLCQEHKVKWCAGSNLFSFWRYQTEDEQRQIYERAGMADCREITDEEAHTHPLVRQWEGDLLKQEEANSPTSGCWSFYQYDDGEGS